MKKYLIACMLLTIIACTKGGGNMYVEGRVYNPVTGEGIEGIQIRLWKEQPSSGPYGPSTSNKYVETVYTNADGHYEIKHTGIFQAFYLKVTDYGENFPIGWVDISTKKKNYADVIPINSVKIIKSKNMHADFQAVPYGYIQLNIHNISCMDINDHFVLYAEGIEVDNSVNGVMIDEMGCYQLNTSGYSKVPIGGRYYRWVVTRNGVTNTYYDTTYIAEGEYKIYTINY